ncbi:unnamed protein product [Brassica oleracea var. botrytis]
MLQGLIRFCVLVYKMASSTLRRRLHHGDVDGRKYERYDAADSETLSEPLLRSSSDSKDTYNEELTLEDIWEEERKRQQVHWTLIFSQLIAQWAQWIAKVVFGSGSLFGKFLSLSHIGSRGRHLPPPLSMLQEERLRNIKRRIEIPFDGSRMEHQDALRQLWRLAYPQRELPPLKSELWKEMGWQGTDPSTDFRGGGYISLENLIFFAKTYPESFHRLLHKQDGTRAEWEYPFAVAGINISFMLAQTLDLQSGKPSTLAGIRFLEFLEEDEMAFDNLYCVAFQMMDAQWLAKRASYMEFNDVLKSTRAQLEHELALEDVSSIKDLLSFKLLHK